MPDSTTDSRLRITQGFLAHLGHRDVEQSMEFLSPHVTYTLHGIRPLAAVFSGRTEVMGHLMELAEKTDGTFDALKWEDWMPGEQHVAALANIRAEIPGRRLTSHVLFLTKFDVDDQIVEVEVFFEDHQAVARFFGQ